MQSETASANAAPSNRRDAGATLSFAPRFWCSVAAFKKQTHNFLCGTKGVPKNKKAEQIAGIGPGKIFALLLEGSFSSMPYFTCGRWQLTDRAPHFGGLSHFTGYLIVAISGKQFNSYVLHCHSRAGQEFPRESTQLSGVRRHGTG